MSSSDPIADFLTKIRNALQAQHRFVDVKWSKLKQSITEILKDEGLIENFIVKQEKNGGVMRVFLKYSAGRVPVIQKLKRVSRPGLRKYIGSEQIPTFFGGLGLTILSTSQGVLSGNEAKKRKIGGELICSVQ